MKKELNKLREKNTNFQRKCVDKIMSLFYWVSTRLTKSRNDLINVVLFKAEFVFIIALSARYYLVGFLTLNRSLCLGLVQQQVLSSLGGPRTASRAWGFST